jgi:BirA family biotin operon repressor/biotin-[acetyl-CoA-carboxylase] ligase
MIFTENHRKLLTHLAEGDFYSSIELSSALSLNQMVIYKYLEDLSTLGLEIIKIKDKGYQLNRKLEWLSATKIKQSLQTNTLSLLASLEIHPYLSSTNSYLLKQIKTKATCTDVCFAEYQTHGRGRYGRQWVSPFGTNIYLSLSWLFKTGFASITGLSLAIGVAVVRALTEIGVDNIGLKWPNDIYWQDKKLGGILIELSNEVSQGCYAVIGLGLNLYLPKKETTSITQPWIDLEKIIPTAHYSRNYLSALLLNHLLAILVDFEQKTLKNYLPEWRQYDCMQGREVSIYKGQQRVNGIMIGVDDDGKLQLKEHSGQIIAFSSAEISFREIDESIN